MNYKGIEKNESPCDRYVFVVEKYQEQMNGWFQNYYYGAIYNRSGQQILTVKSNSCFFWHCWMVIDGNPFLICNENANGYTVIDVNNAMKFPYIDRRASTGFVWKKVSPSPDGQYLAVQGDYMDIGREIAVFDLSKPTDLPLRRIKSLKSGNIKLLGWEDNKVVMEGTTTFKIAV